MDEVTARPNWFYGMDGFDQAQFVRAFRVTDEALFYSTVMSGGHKWARKAAAQRLTDQELLWRTATEDAEADVRLFAAVCLTDPQKQAELALTDPSGHFRRKLAGILEDEDALFEVATRHPEWDVRRTVTERMNDQERLAGIVQTDEKDAVRMAAALRIWDPEIARVLFDKLSVANVILAPCPGLRAALARRLTDQALLAALSTGDPDYRVRVAATEGLTDQALLKRIVDDQSRGDLVRAAAARRVTDQEALRRYAETYCHKLAPYEIGEAALSKLEDQQFLKEVAEGRFSMHALRKAAAEQVSDEDILFEWAMRATHSGFDDVNLADIAARRVRDPAHLAEIAMGAAEFGPSEIAVGRLEDDGQLLRVINGIGARTDRWNDAVGESYAEYVLVEQIKSQAADNIREVSLLIEPALADPGDHYDMYCNAKESYIRRLAGDSEALRRYARLEKDGYALQLAAGFSCDRQVLELISQKSGNGSAVKYAAYKLKCLDRLPQIGMAEA